MFYVPQLPCYKIYKQSNHALRIVWFENETSMGHFQQDCVGDFLIRFLEMDLTEYIKAVEELGAGTEFNFRLLSQCGFTEICDKMYDTADLLSSSLHLHRFLVADTMKYLQDETLSEQERLQKAYLELLYIVQMYRQFTDALAFCLDADQVPDMAVARKLTIFMQTSKRFANYKFQTGYGIAPVDKHGNLDYGTVRELNDVDADVLTQLDSAQNEKGGVSLLPFTWILTFEDLIFFDFLELVSRGLAVKRCKHCGKYFVQKTRHKTEYCDRKTENGRTCKQVGPKMIFNAQLEKAENAPLREYERIRRMKQQQLERDRNRETAETMGQAQAAFDAWSVPAMAARERFVAGEISEEKFLTGIKK